VISVSNQVVQAFTEGLESKAEDVKVAYEFAKEFKERMVAANIGKRFIRLIEDKT
jgi:hypothetical protein